MNRYFKVAGLAAFLFLIALAFMLKKLSDARIEEGAAAARKAAIYDRLTHPGRYRPPPPEPNPDDVRRRQAEGDAARTLTEAWNAYWSADLQKAMQLLTEERQRNRSSFYRKEYFDGLITALPSYDSDLRKLQNERASASQSNVEGVVFKIYQLSKVFYQEHGMEAETSMVYGPEFKEAESFLLGKNEEVTRNHLLASWLPEGGSCYMDSGDKPIQELSEFLKVFPDSPKHGEIEALLNSYSSGEFLCGNKNRRE